MVVWIIFVQEDQELDKHNMKKQNDLKTTKPNLFGYLCGLSLTITWIIVISFIGNSEILSPELKSILIIVSLFGGQSSAKIMIDNYK